MPPPGSYSQQQQQPGLQPQGQQLQNPVSLSAPAVAPGKMAVLVVVPGFGRRWVVVDKPY